jgi:hypothetical protein
VLLDPASHKGLVLKHNWDDAQKPDRHVICYTYVPASVHAKRLLPPEDFKEVLPIFIHNNDDISFYLESHLGDVEREDVSLKIIVRHLCYLIQYVLSKVVLPETWW